MELNKGSLKNIPKDTQDLFENYVKLFKIKQSEKLVLVMGIIASVFLLCFFILLISFLLAFGISEFFNELLASNYLGYFVSSLILLIVIAIFSLLIVKNKKPILTGLILKYLISILNLQISTSKNLKGLKYEIEKTELVIENSKLKIKADFSSIRHAILDSILKDFLGYFNSPKTKKDASDSDTISEEPEIEK